MKKLLALVMSFAIVISTIPGVTLLAFAESDSSLDEGQTYTLNIVWNDGCNLSLKNNKYILSKEWKKIGNKNGLVLTFAEDTYSTNIELECDLDNGYGLQATSGPMDCYTHDGKTINLSYIKYSYEEGTYEATTELTFGTSAQAKSKFDIIAPNGVFTIDSIKEIGDNSYLSSGNVEDYINELPYYTLNHRGLSYDDYSVDVDSKTIACKVDDVSYIYNCTIDYATTNTSILNKSKTIGQKLYNHGAFYLADTDLIKAMMDESIDLNGDPAVALEQSYDYKNIISGWGYQVTPLGRGGGSISADIDDSTIDLGFVTAGTNTLDYNNVTYCLLSWTLYAPHVLYVSDDCAESKVLSIIKQRITQATGKNLEITEAGYVKFFDEESLNDLNERGIDTDKLTKKYYKITINEEEYYFLVERNTEKLNRTATSCSHDKLTFHKAVDSTCDRQGHIAYYSCNQCGKYFSDEEATQEINKNIYTAVSDKHCLTHHKARNGIGNISGNIEYWSCADCSKCFLDANGDEEIESYKVSTSMQSWDNGPYYDVENNILYANGNTIAIVKDGSATTVEYTDSYGDTRTQILMDDCSIYAGNVSKTGHSVITVDDGSIDNIIIADTDKNKSGSNVDIEINGGQVNNIILGGTEEYEGVAISANIINNSSCTPKVIAGLYCDKAMSASIVSKQSLAYKLKGSFDVSDEVKTWPYTCINGMKWFKLHTQGGILSGSTYKVYGSYADLPTPYLENCSFKGWSGSKYYYWNLNESNDESPYYYDIYAFYYSESDIALDSAYLLYREDDSSYSQLYSLASGSKHNIYNTTISKDADITRYAVLINGEYIVDFSGADNSLNQWSRTYTVTSPSSGNSETYCFKIKREQDSTTQSGNAICGQAVFESYSSATIDINVPLRENEYSITVNVPNDTGFITLSSVASYSGSAICDTTYTNFNGSNSAQMQITVNGHVYTITFVKKAMTITDTIETLNSRISAINYNSNYNLSESNIIKIADPAKSGLEDYQSDIYNILINQMSSRYYLALMGLKLPVHVEMDPTIQYTEYGTQDTVGYSDLEEGAKYYWNPAISTYYEENGIFYTATTSQSIPISFEYVDDIDQVAAERIKDNQTKLDNNQLSLNNLCYSDTALLKSLVYGGTTLTPDMRQKDTLHADVNAVNNNALTSGTNLRIALSYGSNYADATDSLFGSIATRGYYYVDDVYYADVEGYKDEMMYSEGVIIVPSGTKKSNVLEAIENKAEVAIADSGYTVAVEAVSPTDLFAKYNDGTYKQATRAYYTDGGLALYSGTEGTAAKNFVGFVDFTTGLENVGNIDKDKLYTSETLDYVDYGGLVETDVQAYQVYCISTERNSVYALAECEDGIPCEHDKLVKVKEEGATCQEDGHCTYYKCVRCEAKFLDSEGTIAASDEDVVTEHKTGHSITHRVAKMPSATSDGNIEYWECADCGAKFFDKEGKIAASDEDVIIPAIGEGPYLDVETGILYTNNTYVTIDEDESGNTIAKYSVNDQLKTIVLPEGVKIFAGNLDENYGWQTLQILNGHIDNIILAKAKNNTWSYGRTTVYIAGGIVDTITIGSIDGLRAIPTGATVSNTSTSTPELIVGNWIDSKITADIFEDNFKANSICLTGNYSVSDEVKQLPYVNINGEQLYILDAGEGSFTDGSKVKTYFGTPEEMPIPLKNGAHFTEWEGNYDHDYSGYQYEYKLEAAYIDNSDTTPTRVIVEYYNGTDWSTYSKLYSYNDRLSYSCSLYNTDDISKYRLSITGADSTVPQIYELTDDGTGGWSRTVKLYSKDGKNSDTYTFTIEYIGSSSQEKSLYYNIIVNDSQLGNININSNSSTPKNHTVYVPEGTQSVQFAYVYANGYENVTYQEIVQTTEDTTKAYINCDSETYTITIVKKDISVFKEAEDRLEKINDISNLCKTIKIADPSITGIETGTIESYVEQYHFANLVLAEWGYENTTGSSIELYYDRQGLKSVDNGDLEEGQKYYAKVTDSLWTRVDEDSYSLYDISKETLIPIKFEYVSDIDNDAVAKIKENPSLISNMSSDELQLSYYDYELIKALGENNFNSSYILFNTSMRNNVLKYANNNLYKKLKGNTSLSIVTMLGGAGDGGRLTTGIGSVMFYFVDGVYYGREAYPRASSEAFLEHAVNVSKQTTATKMTTAARDRIAEITGYNADELSVSTVSAEAIAQLDYPEATRAYVTENGVALYSGSSGTSKSQFIGFETGYFMPLSEWPDFEEMNLYSNTTLSYLSEDGGKTSKTGVKAYQVFLLTYEENEFYFLINLTDEVCQHVDVIHHAATTADCDNDGNKEYYECKECGKYYSDSELKNEIVANSWVIKKTHSAKRHVAHAATCTEDGNTEYWSCTKCGRFFSDEKCTNEIEEDSWITSQTGHTMVHHAAKEATCRQTGNREYWECSNCGKLFLDAEGVNETSENAVLLEKKGHKWNEGTIIEIQESEGQAIVEYECEVCHQTKTGALKIKARVNASQTQTLTDSNLANSLAEMYGSASTVTSAMTQKAKTETGISTLKIEGADKYTQELAVEISSNNGSTYEDMSSENTPEGGVSVVIPYPEGKDSSYDYVITHMYDQAVGNHQVGDIEVFSNPIKTKDGLKITLESASPIQIICMPGEGTASVSGVLYGYNGVDDVSYELSKLTSETKSYQSNDGEYSFNGLSAGQYTLKVSASGDYVDRDYTVNVEQDGDLVLEDVSIYELGDTNIDGVRDASDITRIARHLARLSVEQDDYTLKLFNTDRSEDGKITAADATKLARFAAGIVGSL